MPEPYEELTSIIIRQELILKQREEECKAAKKMLAAAEQELLDAFENGSVPEKFSAHGETWSRDMRTFVRPNGRECTEVVVQWITEHGGADLVKETMHAQSRDKFLRETLLDEDGLPMIPPELEGFVKVDDFPKITRRKA